MNKDLPHECEYGYLSRHTCECGEKHCYCTICGLPDYCELED